MPVSFPGFTLPSEQVALRDQVRRFVRDDIVSVEQRIDPDAEVHRRVIARALFR